MGTIIDLLTLILYHKLYHKTKSSEIMKIITKNKEGLYDYEILESWTAGIVLSGPEVKSVKLGQISLKGAFVQTDSHNEVWLVNAYIGPYKPAKSVQTGYDPSQRRKLLLKKREIDSILGKKSQKGLTIIPISVYTNRRLIKVEIGLARSKSKIDKREAIKKRETKREIDRLVRK
jgi:SsrA-binding protein